MLRFLEIAARHHHLSAPGFQRPLHHVCQIILVYLLAVVLAAIDWVTEIDADLCGFFSTCSMRGAVMSSSERWVRTNIYISQLLLGPRIIRVINGLEACKERI